SSPRLTDEERSAPEPAAPARLSRSLAGAAGSGESFFQREIPQRVRVMEVILLRQSCLLVTDVQRGFTTLHPDELPVPGGVEIVPKINLMMELPWARIDATQDWHPPDHRSFHGRQDNLYPPHCVMGTPGAEFLPGLHTHKFHTIWRKGFHSDQ